MEEINDITLKRLDNMVEKIPDDMPTFKGISIDKFNRKALIKLCKLFANEWRKAKENHLSANAELSCIYISDVVPAPEIQSCLIHEPVPSSLKSIASCLTELPKYPGEKLKWQRSKTLLRTYLKYIKQMLLTTRLFYDNSQKNSE